MTYTRAVVALALLVVAVSAKQTALPPYRLLADGSNWNEDRSFVVGSMQPRLSWAPQHTRKGARAMGVRVVVTETLREDVVVWDAYVATKEPFLTYAGQPLKPGAFYDWKVAVQYEDEEHVSLVFSPSARFHVPPSNDMWESSMWIGSTSENRYRGEFNVSGVSKMMVYVCGLGYSKVSMNGVQVSSHLTTAPWTNNERINAYSSLDVTDKVVDGANVVGVELGFGWRDTKPFPNKDGDQGKDIIPKVVRLVAVATYTNGTTATVFQTDSASAWKAIAGPVVADSVYNGETYDARIAATQAGWSAPGFVGSGWTAANVLPAASAPAGGMVPWTGPAVEIKETRAPVSITLSAPNVYTVDFGENLAGVTKLVNVGNCGNITIRHAEILQHAGIPGLDHPEPGRVYMANLRTAQATDTYICSGGTTTESWYPSFTYHGFRYVEVTVAGGDFKLTADNIQQIHFHSDVAETTQPKFSSDTLNKIQTMAVGAQRSNQMTVITDCDQRDERLGWMGDANLSGESICVNFDCVEFLEMFVMNMAAEMDADGSLPDVVPFNRYGGRPADVSWSAAFINSIHALWKIGGQDGPIVKYFPLMLAQIENVARQASKGLANMHTPYGDWCPPPAKIGGGQGPKPSKPYTSAVSYLHMVDQMVQLSDACGNTTAKAMFEQVLVDLKKEFNTAFAHSDNGYDTNCQTALTLALSLGVPADPNATSDALINAVEKTSNSHYTTGIIGFKFLFEMLNQANRADLALTVLSQVDYPSIGFYFANTMEPATTNLWELPDALGEGTGMNSRNHHMWSSYSHYLVVHVAGVGQTEESTGYRTLDLRAGASGEGLIHAHTKMELRRGDVEWSWQRIGGRQTDKAAEGDAVHLNCGAGGGVIRNITFASYGSPAVIEGKLREINTCHARRSHAVVNNMCQGKKSCDVEVSSSLFFFASEEEAAECMDTLESPRRLWVSAVCSEPLSIKAIASVPVSSTAVLRFPTKDIEGVAVIRDDSSQALLTNNRELPLGITAITATHDEVIVHVTSGDHELTLLSASK